MKPRPAREAKPWACDLLSGQAPLEAGRQRRPTVAFGNLPLTGQALAELAILGSLMILALGSLVSYGLRYNQQQKLSQEAFRETLKIVSETEKDEDGNDVNVKHPQASYTIIEDKHIPDSANPFAFGSVSPTIASASVTRDWAMQLTPGNKKDLPHMRIRINGEEIKCDAVTRDGPGCTTAGWREENDVEATETTIDKYIEIFGQTVEGCTNVDGDNECAGQWKNIYDYDDDGGRSINGDIAQSCSDEEAIVNPETGDKETICNTYSLEKIKFIDSSAGEIMDYDGAVRQCRQLVDEDFCIKECNKGRAPETEDVTNCKDLCAEKFNPPNQTVKTYDPDKGGAWYCANYEKKNGRYTFPVLDAVFSQVNPDDSSAPKEMGLLSSYTQSSAGSENSLRKEESANKTITTSTQGWKSTFKRTLRYINPRKAQSLTEDDISSLIADTKYTYAKENEIILEKPYDKTICVEMKDGKCIQEKKTTTWTTDKR